MCIKCSRKSKRLGLLGVSYGQIKAMAQNIVAQGPIAIHGLFMNRNDIAVESHLFKISQAKRKRQYKEKKYSPVDELA
jgi:hypothetical protein